jgi:hypothetical protein
MRSADLDTATVNPQVRKVIKEKGPDRQDWMTSTEVCKFLGTDHRNLRRWVDSGRAPAPAATTASGYHLWSPEQREALLKARRRSRA